MSHAQRPSKQRRLEALRAICTGGSFQEAALARVLHQLRVQPSLLDDLGNADSSLRNSLAENSSSLLAAMGTQVQLRQDDGKKHTVTIASPDNVLQHFAEKSAAFGELVSDRLGRHSCPFRLILYHDEVTPGNVLRPDNKCKFSAVYMSFMEMGHHLRNELAWLPVAVVRHGLATSTHGGLSGCLLEIFRTCWGNGRLDLGVLIKTNAGPKIFSYVVGNVLADEAALKATWAVKGASGTRPCIVCKNVLSKGSLQNQHAFLVEIDCEDPDKFHSMSDQEWFDTADHLMSQRNTVTKTALHKLEQTTGLNCVEGGLMHDAEMRQIVRPTLTTFDSMHVWLNNGVCNTEVQVFLAAAKEKCGLTYGHVRNYIAAAPWKPPGGQRDFAQHVFSESRERSNKESFKCMASEMLAILPLLRQLVVLTLSGRPQIQAELASFLAACECIDVLQDIKDTAASAEKCSALLLATRRHLQLHKAAYGSQHLRPKNHFALHLPAQILRDGMLIDAFVLERKHRCAKSIASSVDNTKAFEYSVLSRMLMQQIDNMPSSFVKDSLLGTVVSGSEVCALLEDEDCKVSERARCHGFEIGKEDVLFSVGVALQAVIFVSQESGLSALVNVFEFSEKWHFATKWRQRKGTHLFSFTNSFTRANYWRMEDGVLLTM